MNNQKVFRYFELAKEIALREPWRPFIHGAVAIRSDGAVVKSPNCTNKSPNHLSHAEARVVRKLDYDAPAVFVIRIRRDNLKLALSKPCFDCMKKMISKNVQRVFYSIGEGEYGVIDNLFAAIKEMK